MSETVCGAAVRAAMADKHCRQFGARPVRSVHQTAIGRQLVRRRGRQVAVVPEDFTRRLERIGHQAGGHGAYRVQWKSSFLSQLTDGAIDTLIECFAHCPSAMSQISLEHLHGAASRVGVTDTAFPHRSPGYNLLVLSQWSDARVNAEGTAWARETYSAMQPYMAATRYVNYLDQDESADTVAASYGINYRRLQAVKAKYDPGNVFHLNQNIRPAGRT